MRTTNAMQLKARIKNSAREAGIPAQSMMQNYLFERLLERLSKSEWRDSVVIKGGMLISSLVGVASRTTMDLDTTIRGFDLTHETAATVFRQISTVEVDDDWEFDFTRTEDIRETDDYPGIRVRLKANYAPMSVPLTVDVTTGDKIIPGPIEYEYPLLFDKGSISLMSYTIETVLAEKLETLVSRGVTNTRPRDFYDIHTLWRLRGDECDPATLREAVEATCTKRESITRMAQWEQVLSAVASDQAMLALWAKYAKKNPYATGIELARCCEDAKAILSALSL